MIDFNYFSLKDAHKACGVVVVIDVLRAFTTAAHAFNQGALKIYPVASVAEALMLKEKTPGTLIMGEVDGNKPEEFDIGNSPEEVSRCDLRGKIMIQRTSAGTQGIVRTVNASHLFAASFVVAKATADHIRTLFPDAVSFIITGESMGRDGEEDRACGEYIQALLEGDTPHIKLFTDRVLRSTAGVSFLTGEIQRALSKDLAMSVQADRFTFSLPVYREGSLLAMFMENL